MDICCPRCGEDWDIDTLHEAAESQGQTFTFVLGQFYKVGCSRAMPSIVGSGKACPITIGDKAIASQALYDIMGEDVDGIASGLEDFEANMEYGFGFN